jgi:hypothetical protein
MHRSQSLLPFRIGRADPESRPGHKLACVPSQTAWKPSKPVDRRTLDGGPERVKRHSRRSKQWGIDFSQPGPPNQAVGVTSRSLVENDLDRKSGCRWQ